MPKPIKIAVVGSRSFTNKKLCWNILDNLQIDNDCQYIQLVSGAARGADTFGEEYADYHNIPKLIFPTQWDKYGCRAGFIRNVDIIKNSDVCIAFWDDVSHGTAHDLELCQEYNKTCWVYHILTGELELYHQPETNEELF